VKARKTIRNELIPNQRVVRERVSDSITTQIIVTATQTQGRLSAKTEIILSMATSKKIVVIDCCAGSRSQV
jgi:hypothetical protein